MKAPWILTTVLAAIGVGWGVREERALASLREQHRLVLVEAKALGISTNPSAGDAAGIHSKRQREDSVRKTKEFAGVLVAFAKEMQQAEKSGKDEEAGMQRRVMEMLDQLLSLNSEELRILITELRGNPDLDDEMRRNLIGFSIMMLSQDHPEKALAIFTESSDLLKDDRIKNHVLSSALTQWAKDQPQAAVAWMNRNASKFPDLINDEAKRAVISGAAEKDFGLAFQLAAELKLPGDDSLLPIMARAAGTPEKQKELLAVIRKQAAGMADGKEAAEFAQKGVACLFSQVSQSGYEKTMDWLQSANLSEQETNGIVVDIQYHRTKADTGKWLDWIGGRNDSKSMQDVTRNLVRDWTRSDYKAAGEWLAGAPAEPNKEAAVISYAETVAPYDSDVAAQWAETLSGERRVDALKRIYSALKSKDPAAAGEFAKSRGLSED